MWSEEKKEEIHGKKYEDRDVVPQIIYSYFLFYICFLLFR